MIFHSKIKIFVTLLLFLNLTNCGFIDKPDWSKTAEPSGKKRAQQNLKEGKGISLIPTKKRGGDFLFASSNPLWRASIETIDFMSLATVDYAGGLIITDWYNDKSSNEAIKITIKFLTNEVRSDALAIDIHKRICSNSINCKISKINSEISFEIKEKIIRQAAIYQNQLDQNIIDNAPKKVFRGDNE